MKKTLTRLVLLFTLTLLLFGCKAAEYGKNLIKNGNFTEKNGSLPANWYADSYSTSVAEGTFSLDAQGCSDAGSAKIDLTEANDARFVQDVSVAPQTIYKLTAWVKTENVADDFGIGANLSVIGNFYKSTVLVGNTGWTKLELYGRTASGQDKLSVALRLGFYSGECYGTVWFDNITLEAVKQAPAGVAVADFTDQMSNNNKGNNNNNVVDKDLEAEQAKLIAIALLALLAGYIIHGMLRRPGGLLEHPVRKSLVGIGLVLSAGLLARLLVALSYRGFDVDISCFTSWGYRMLSVGPGRFYSAGWCDYPPLYMFVNAFSALLQQLFHLDWGTANGALLFKLPNIAADLLTAWLLYRMVDKKGKSTLGLLLAAFYVFNPAVIINSSSWGQADSFFTLLLVLSLNAIMQKKLFWSTIWYVVAVLTKPQALVFGPIWLAATLWQVFQPMTYAERVTPKRIKLNYQGQFLWGAGISIVLFVAITALMGDIIHNPFWLVKKYIETIKSYEYASLSAFNLMALLGGQWAPLTKGVAGAGSITFGGLHVFFIFVLVGLGLALYFFMHRQRNRQLYLIAALFGVGAFVLLGSVHERYMFPALILLLLAYTQYEDKRLLFCFGGFSALSYINVSSVLFLHYSADEKKFLYFTANDPVLIACSAATVALFVYFVYVIFKIQALHNKPLAPAITIKGEAVSMSENVQPTAPERAENTEAAPALSAAPAAATEVAQATEEANEKERGDMPHQRYPTKTALLYARREERRLEQSQKKRLLTGKDWLIMLAVTVLYAGVALFNLGNTKSAQTYWQPQTRGEAVTVDFGSLQQVGKIFCFHNINEGSLSISYSADGEQWQSVRFSQSSGETYQLKNGDIFKWETLAFSGGAFSARYVQVQAENAYIRINEMAFFAPKAETPLPIAKVTGTANSGNHPYTALFNEQSLVPARESYLNSMYFDEIYHARTAYEQANNWAIYEVTHPPLGKDFMTLSVLTFGMTPFAWRLPGALMGIFMLPALFIFGKLLFRKTWAGAALMLLMALDGMHLTQTRLATVDSYAVFFIIVMFLFMYKYFTMSFFEDKLWRTLVPLGLSGFFFGLGAASKWTGLYAGAGLAILFFATMFKRQAEYNHACISLRTEELPPAQREYLQHIRDTYHKKTLITLGCCVLFFLIIPFAIYALSYIPYYTAPGNKGNWLSTLLANQDYMFGYHSGLKGDTHPFRSAWYEWPLIVKPMWYYAGSNLPTNQIECISAMGNPVIWYAGLAATVASIALLCKRIFRATSTNVKKALTAKRENAMLAFLSIGLAANYLAWVLVPRSTFIYHYFASLPFIMAFTVYILCKAVKRFNSKEGSAKTGYLAVRAGIVAFFVLALAMAVLFYPVWSGAQVDKFFVKDYLVWFQGWFFYSG